MKSGNITKNKPTIILMSAVILLIVGCGMLIAGFIVHPPGEIHNSVLVAFGEILTFVGAVFGMKYRYQYGQSSHNYNSDNEENK